MLYPGDNFFSVGCHEDLAAGLEKHFDAFPSICNETRRGARCLKHASCWRETVLGHAVPANIEHRTRTCVEGIVISGVDLIESLDIPAPGLVGPSRSA